MFNMVVTDASASGIVQYIFSNMRAGVRPFGIFPKISTVFVALPVPYVYIWKGGVKTQYPAGNKVTTCLEGPESLTYHKHSLSKDGYRFKFNRIYIASSKYRTQQEQEFWWRVVLMLVAFQTSALKSWPNFH